MISNLLAMMNHEPLKECTIDVPLALQILSAAYRKKWSKFVFGYQLAYCRNVMWQDDYTTEETLYIGPFMKSVEALCYRLPPSCNQD